MHTQHAATKHTSNTYDIHLQTTTIKITLHTNETMHEKTTQTQGKQNTNQQTTHDIQQQII